MHPLTPAGDGQSKENAIYFPEAHSYEEGIHAIHRYLADHNLTLECQALAEQTETHVIDRIDTDRGTL